MIMEMDELGNVSETSEKLRWPFADKKRDVGYLLCLWWCASCEGMNQRL